jgi:release factor glutamine methyltransferase
MSDSPTSTPSDWTIGRLLSWTTEYLRRHGVDDPRLSTEVLLAKAAECRRIDLYTRFDRTLEDPQIERLRDWVRRAAAHEPVAYLVGEREFFSHSFLVNRDVLIPRPETETLVECVVDQCGQRGWLAPKIMDLGTGCGCIAVVILTQIPAATAVATDISGAALRVAATNAARHNVADRMLMVLADGLNLPGGVVPTDGFDVLVSNPPYIPADQVPALRPEIKDYEPKAALTDGEDGLSFYRIVGRGAAKLLAPNGLVVMEVADGQGPSAIAALQAGGSLELLATRKDRVTGKERVLVLKKAYQGG